MPHPAVRAALCAILSLSAISVMAQGRLSIPLDTGWRFQQIGELSGVQSPAFDDSGWTAVDIPHTWNRIGNTGYERSALSNNVQGVGWYRLHFKAPRAASGSRYFLQFDAVGSIADVWLNGAYLGTHQGAFSRFRFDASRFIAQSGDNVLVVKADNSRPRPGASTQDVIPLSGDFFVFGGIYRSVELIVTPAVHVDLLDFGGPGLYARMLGVDSSSASVLVSGRVVNDAAKRLAVRAEFSIQDSEGHTVASRQTKSPQAPGEVTRDARLFIPHPRLWRGTQDPYLYRVAMTLRSGAGVILDRVTQPLGLRSMRFDPDHGFFLNGEPLPLKGVSMHQDRPMKGWAISRADQRQDFEILQDLGANAVRLAHYPHDQYSYELADALGIVAWAEIPLVNQVSFDGSAADAALTANARQQLVELIRQNYNHPAIALWSIGNEIDLTATQTRTASRPSALVAALNALAKREDPSRATTFADCCEVGIAPQLDSTLAGAAPREPIVGITDTVGYNRYFGWYVGQFADFGAMLDAAHVRHPRLPIAVSEYGAGAALTQHSDDAAGGPVNPHGRPHPEEYQDWYHENSWAVISSREYLWGAYIWNLFDFASDSRAEGDLTDINEKGLVSYDRKTRKDAYYFYRANWSSAPTLHLVGRRYVDRAYAVIDVKAYSNAPQAQLTLNGHDLGAAPCSKGICMWRSVPLSRGANELVASASVAGRAITDSVQWNLSHPATEVRIKAGDISGYVSKDAQRFGSDLYFVGGIGSGVDPPDTGVGQRRSVQAEDAALYDSYRAGDFSYRIPLPNGQYHVLLMFAEPTAIGAGERLFDVAVNGVARIENFDILAAAGGPLKGVNRALDATVTDGILTLAFRPRRGDALVSALSITPLDPR